MMPSEAEVVRLKPQARASDLTIDINGRAATTQGNVELEITILQSEATSSIDKDSGASLCTVGNKLRLVNAGVVVGVDTGTLLVAVVISENTVPNEDLLSFDTDGRSLLTSLVAVCFIIEEEKSTRDVIYLVRACNHCN